MALRLVAPEWLEDMLRADLAREHPGSTAERLATSDAEIQSFLSARNIAPIWSLDQDISSFTTQGVGALNGWPAFIQVLLFIEGSFSRLDGGTNDLGIVRDSTLNSTNNAMVFAETFEGVAMWNVADSSLAITRDVCPDGTTAEAGRYR